MIQEIYNLFGYNKPIFIYINDLTNQGIIAIILQYISAIFFFANFPLFYILTAITIHIKIINKQKSGKDFTDFFNDNFALMTRIGMCYCLFFAIYVLLKFSVNMPRPYCSLNELEFSTIANITSERCLSSFPSAHTAFSILVIYFLWPYLNKPLRILAIIAPISVALSRMSLAMHYPSDILASAIIAPIIIMISNFIFSKIQKWEIFIKVKRLVFKKVYSPSH